MMWEPDGKEYVWLAPLTSDTTAAAAATVVPAHVVTSLSFEFWASWRIAGLDSPGGAPAARKGMYFVVRALRSERSYPRRRIPLRGRDSPDRSPRTLPFASARA